MSIINVIVKRLSPWMLVRQRSTAAGMEHKSLFCGRSNTSLLMKHRIACQQYVIKRTMSQITEGEGIGTHKPSQFQKRVLVLAKMYPSIDKVPDRVTRSQLRVSMDKFRVRASIIMVGLTFVACAIYAYIGRKERDEGKTLSTRAYKKSASST